MAGKTNRRRRVWLRDGQICWICGKLIEWNDMTLDHVIPISKGGAYGIENCHAAHRGCNRERGNASPPLGMGKLRPIRPRRVRPRGPVMEHITNESVRMSTEEMSTEDKIALQKRSEP